MYEEDGDEPPAGRRGPEAPSIGRDEALGLGLRTGRVTFPSPAPFPPEGPVPEAPTEKLFCSIYEEGFGDGRGLGLAAEESSLAKSEAESPLTTRKSATWTIRPICDAPSSRELREPAPRA